MVFLSRKLLGCQLPTISFPSTSLSCSRMTGAATRRVANIYSEELFRKPRSFGSIRLDCARLASTCTISRGPPCDDRRSVPCWRGQPRRGWRLRHSRQRCRRPHILSPIMWPSFRDPRSSALNHRLLSRAVHKALQHVTPGKQPILVSTSPTVPGLFRDHAFRRKVYYCVDDFTHWHHDLRSNQRFLAASRGRPFGSGCVPVEFSRWRAAQIPCRNTLQTCACSWYWLI